MNFMFSGCLRPVLALLGRSTAVVLYPIFLVGCAANQPVGGVTLASLAYETVGTFSTPKGEGQLRQNRLTGAYDMFVNGTSIPVAADSPVLVASQRVRDEQVVVVKGSRPSCPVAYGLYGFDRNAYSASPIGNCRDELAFQNNGKQFFASQVGASDPQFWVYENHQAAGPILRSVLFAPPPSPPAPTVAHAQPRKPAAPVTKQSHTDTAPAVASTPPHVTIKAADGSVVPGEVAIPAALQHSATVVKLDD